MRSSVHVRVQGEITSKGGNDQGAMTDHPRGLRRKVRTSCEKPPYLDRGDDDLKMTQMKGAKCKMWRWVAGRKTRPNRVENRLVQTWKVSGWELEATEDKFWCYGDGGISTNKQASGTLFWSLVDVKSAPYAKHTASRISWLHTRGPGIEIRKRASQFSLKLTKDENG
jgi:hypothetical protein